MTDEVKTFPHFTGQMRWLAAGGSKTILQQQFQIRTVRMKDRELLDVAYEWRDVPTETE